MKKIFPILLLTVFSNWISAQTNSEKFKKLFADNDTTNIKILLADWEKSKPGDAEFYTSAFNYYYSNSKNEVNALEKTQRGEESLELLDSAGTIAGYMNSYIDYNPACIDKAFFYINKGIEKFPSRLDIRFGKCYVLGELANYKDFTNEIINTVKYSTTIKNAWLWTENKKLEDGENYMLSSIQGYLKQLYDTGDDKLLENMKQIGDITIKRYPANVEILSTTAVAYMLTEKYDKAIVYLKQAEKINPKDYIVLSNIAQGYTRKGDKENAIKYYELTEKYGDEYSKQLAKSELKKLKN
ncbi:MAG: tetratricopeptide repeat protein [Bacteroidota bacterium]